MRCILIYKFICTINFQRDLTITLRRKPMTPMKLRPALRAAVLTLALFNLPAFASADTLDAAAVVRQYAALVEANYADTLSAAQSLQTAVNAFTAAPGAESLSAARKAWLAAREQYGQTEAFRFYGGPIDSDTGPEGRINAWPMDESFVDGVAGKTKAGLINNAKFKISKKTLAAMNERGGEENIATGWHAVEFLLWGQDQSETGAGNRSADDFIDGKAANAERRRLYLKTATDLLVDDLASVTAAWSPNAKNYRAKFEKGGTESLRKMFVGMGSLSRGELAGERMEVALASQNQEDEHSCFSDNTHRDIVQNARGIQNVWLGEFKRADGSVVAGASLRALVAEKDAVLADKLTQQLATSVAAAEGIQAPFDREIVGGADAPGRIRIQKTVASLAAQAKDIVSAAGAVGIKKLTLVQP
jgi:putative iron-regulated protein